MYSQYNEFIGDRSQSNTLIHGYIKFLLSFYTHCGRKSNTCRMENRTELQTGFNFDHGEGPLQVSCPVRPKDHLALEKVHAMLMRF